MINSLITFSAKDWLFFFNEQLKEIPFLPFIWDPTRGNGFGENISSLLWIKIYQTTTTWTLFNVFKFNWLIIESIIFYLAFIFLSTVSIFTLTKTVFGNKSKIIYAISFIVFIVNTYSFMVFGGGQLGIILAYAASPLTLAFFIRLINNLNNSLDGRYSYRDVILFSYALSLQTLFDPRISFITFLGIILFFLYSLLDDQVKFSFFKKTLLRIKKTLIVLILPSFIAVLLHFFWILPFIMTLSNPLSLGDGTLPTVESVKFFSFADFSHSLSFLHPNWPQNIFGKVYFLQPEFLVLPILAFSSLLFLKTKLKNEKNESRMITFFVLMGLMGIFLAKGSNDPFGSFYLFLFKKVPGFNMYRDPTKFYLLISLSYSILIPFTIHRVYEGLKSKIKNQKSKLILKIQNYSLFLFIFIIFLLLLSLVRQLFMGQVGGTFKIHQVSNEYVKLKDLLNNDPVFSRTLWIPQKERYGFYSQNHPAVSASYLFKGASSSAVLKILKNGKYKGKDLDKYFADLGIKYVILPIDQDGEFFVEDRKYSPKVRGQLDKDLEEISWLKKINDFKEISLYEIDIPQTSLFSLVDKGSEKKNVNLKWQMVSPVKYKVEINSMNKDNLLVFSEAFDRNWIASLGNEKVNAKKIDQYQNGFEILKKGSYTIVVEYEAQKYFYYGLIISSLTLLTTLLLLRFKKL